jgi:ribosomal protein S18 acetylase RimI-like enzyme
MLAAVIDGARAAGCAAIDLEVDRDHARAAHLYARSGFTSLPRARWVRLLAEEE